jgi:hypothetical protein
MHLRGALYQGRLLSVDNEIPRQELVGTRPRSTIR